MSADAATVTSAVTAAETSGVASGEAAAPPRIAGGRGRLALLAAAAVSLCAGGGLWFGGWLPGWLGVPRDRAASVAAPVLIDAHVEIVGDADIEDAVRLVGHDVGPAAAHGADVAYPCLGCQPSLA